VSAMSEMSGGTLRGELFRSRREMPRRKQVRSNTTSNAC